MRTREDLLLTYSIMTGMGVFDHILSLAQKRPISDILDHLSHRMNIRKLPKKWQKSTRTRIMEDLDAVGDWGVLRYRVEGNILRLELSPDGDVSSTFDDLPKCLVDPDLEAVIFDLPATNYVPYRTDVGFNFENEWELSQSSAYEPYECKFDIHRAGDFTRLTFDMEFEGAYGLGDKTGDFRRKGRYVFWNYDDADHSVESDPLYQSHPVVFLRTHKGYLGLLIDSPAYQTWQIDEGVLDIVVESDRIVVYAFFGERFRDAYRTLTSVIGTFTLPPLWALGYQQSRWSYSSDKEVKAIYNGHISRDIPLDAIYLDIAYMDRYRCFTVNTERFSDISLLSSEIKGVVLVAIIDAGISVSDDYPLYKEGESKGYFVRTRSNQIFKGRVWPGICVFPDFYREEVRQWWGEQYRSLLEQGVVGFWNDMNEPSIFSIRRTFPKDLISGGTKHGKHHNTYGMMMGRASFEGLERLNPDRRNFVLTRSSYPGGQNFAWMWTGDNSATWDFLRLSVRQMLSLGISGQPLCGSDVGGFRGTPDPLLFLRWVQLGVFYPLFRNHTAFDTAMQEVWEFGDEILRYCREAIRLRYRLLPYIYTQIFLSSLGEGPLVRPLFYYGDNVEEVFADRQFFFGRDLLVAPVLTDTGAHEIYLPQGSWFDFHTGERIEGGRTITIEVTLGSIPVFARDGSAVPVARAIGQNTYSTLRKGIEVMTFGADPRGILYLDDGETKNYRNGDFALYSLPEQQLLYGRESYKDALSKSR